MWYETINIWLAGMALLIAWAGYLGGKVAAAKQESSRLAVIETNVGHIMSTTDSICSRVDSIATNINSKIEKVDEKSSESIKRLHDRIDSEMKEHLDRYHK